MSPTNPCDPDWADLGLKVANMHLDLAVCDATEHEHMRGKIEALSVTVLNDATAPPEYRRAYKERIDWALGRNEFCGSCPCSGCQEEANNREYADYWFFKVHNYPIDASLRAIKCLGCESVFLAYDWQIDTCADCGNNGRCKNVSSPDEHCDDEDLRVWEQEWLLCPLYPEVPCKGCGQEFVFYGGEFCSPCMADTDHIMAHVHGGDRRELQKRQHAQAEGAEKMS